MRGSVRAVSHSTEDKRQHCQLVPCTHARDRRTWRCPALDRTSRKSLGRGSCGVAGALNRCVSTHMTVWPGCSSE